MVVQITENGYMEKSTWQKYVSRVLKTHKCFCFIFCNFFNNHFSHSLDSGLPSYDTYETKDKRYMCVGSLEPQFYNIFIEKLGLTSDEVSQYDNFEENRRKITEIFKTKTQKEWCTIFDGTDACVTPMLDMKNVTSHIHNKQRQTFTTEGDDIIPNPAPRLSRTPGISVGVCRNPQPGEDTVQILTELKFQSNEIDDLLSNGFVYQAEHTSKL